MLGGRWQFQGVPTSSSTDCTSRVPKVGDRVARTSGDQVKFGKWKLAANEVAIVIEVDRDGDFRLRNPAGNRVALLFINQPGVGLSRSMALPGILVRECRLNVKSSADFMVELSIGIDYSVHQRC